MIDLSPSEIKTVVSTLRAARAFAPKNDETLATVIDKLMAPLEISWPLEGPLPAMCSQGHVLNGDTVYTGRRRYCRTCRNIQQQARRARIKQPVPVENSVAVSTWPLEGPLALLGYLTTEPVRVGALVQATGWSRTAVGDALRAIRRHDPKAILRIPNRTNDNKLFFTYALAVEQSVAVEPIAVEQPPVENSAAVPSWALEGPLPETCRAGHVLADDDVIGIHGQRRYCRKCGAAYQRAWKIRKQSVVQPVTFKCGHPKTPENTTVDGRSIRCRQCHVQSSRNYRARQAGRAAPVVIDPNIETVRQEWRRLDQERTSEVPRLVIKTVEKKGKLPFEIDVVSEPISERGVVEA